MKCTCRGCERTRSHLRRGIVRHAEGREGLADELGHGEQLRLPVGQQSVEGGLGLRVHWLRVREELLRLLRGEARCILYSTVLSLLVLFYSELHGTILYSTILCSSLTVLFSAIRYYSLL